MGDIPCVHPTREPRMRGEQGPVHAWLRLLGAGCPRNPPALRRPRCPARVLPQPRSPAQVLGTRLGSARPGPSLLPSTALCEGFAGGLDTLSKV